MICLKHKSKVLSSQARPCRFIHRSITFIPIINLPLGRIIQAGQNIEQRGFSTATFSEDQIDGSLVECNIDILQNFGPDPAIVIGFRQVPA